MEDASELEEVKALRKKYSPEELSHLQDLMYKNFRQETLPEEDDAKYEYYQKKLEQEESMFRLPPSDFDIAWGKRK